MLSQNFDGRTDHRKGEESGLRRLVVAQYGALERLCAAQHSGSAAYGMPRHLWELLPHSDGWCFSPLWQAPRRVQRWNGLRLRDRHLPTDGFLNDSEAKSVRVVERAIDLRARLHLSRHHSERLIVQAMHQTSGGVEESQTGGRGTLKGRDERLELIEWARIARRLAAADRTALTHLPSDGSLAALRIQWLGHWLELERLRLAKLRREKEEFATFGNFSALIRPEDVGRVYDIYKDKSGEHDSVQAVGTWYVYTLLRCGADWRTLLALRRRSTQRMIGRSRTALRPRGAVAWGHMAIVRVEDYEDNLRRKMRSNARNTPRKITPAK